MNVTLNALHCGRSCRVAGLPEAVQGQCRQPVLRYAFEPVWQIGQPENGRRMTPTRICRRVPARGSPGRPLQHQNFCMPSMKPHDDTAKYPPSFSHNAEVVAVGPNGQMGHREAIAHQKRFERKLWAPRPGVWCMVGNGLSNQTFVEGPAGLIAIDTGECIEEMNAALVAVREHTARPVVAVIYTHFHYVSGTTAVLPYRAAADTDGLPIWGHTGIVGNRARMSTEVSGAAARGMALQFGILLADQGPDGLVGTGLGPAYRLAEHAPYTPGFLPPTHTFETTTEAQIAGLQVVMTPAPSDCDDSITIWFPELGLCVNNMVWPTLFNVFPIRGEEYRDPRVLLNGLDHIHGLQADYLLGAHGPPITGRGAISQAVTLYRDSIQFMWDQTVRGINQGLTLGELCETVKLPAVFAGSYLTSQFYGLVEHHVRQIHNGLRGWFDGDEAALFPLPAFERAQRLVAGFGGAAKVRAQVHEALAANDLRWALELATWLIHADDSPAKRVDAGDAADRALLAQVLRAIGQRTSAANIRNWCITRALELERKLDLSRFRRHRFVQADVLASPPETYVHTLRVILDPARSGERDEELAWRFIPGGELTGLRLRHGIAAITDGQQASMAITLDLPTWARILAGKTRMSEAIALGDVKVTGEPRQVLAWLACFDHTTLGN